MAKIDKYEVPEDLYYTPDHAWVRVEGNRIRIGVTDYLQKMAGGITFVRVPRAGKSMEAGRTLASLQSGKWAGKISVPMTSMVVEANKDAALNPKLLNEDPYGRGWIAVLEPTNLSEGLANLFHGEKAVEWLKGEIAAHAHEAP